MICKETFFSVFQRNFHLMIFISYFSEEVKPRIGNGDGAPSLVVISRPNISFSSPNHLQSQSIDLSKNSPIHVATISSSSITSSTPIVKALPVTNLQQNGFDDSRLNLLTSDTSGYITNSTDTSSASVSFNHKSQDDSLTTEQQLQHEVQRIQQQAVFNPAMTGGRRRTISSNSNR